MEINLLREIVTVASFAAFVAIVVFAAHPRNKARFDAAARVPLDEDDPFSASPLRGEGRDEGR